MDELTLSEKTLILATYQNMVENGISPKYVKMLMSCVGWLYLPELDAAHRHDLEYWDKVRLFLNSMPESDEPITPKIEIVLN